MFVHAKAHDFKCEVKWSGTNQEGAGKTLGEEVEQCNAFLSRISVTTKHMSKAGRNDMLTLLAIRWNQQKCPNLAPGLSQRYHKTSKALNIPIGDLETLKAQHQLGEQTVEEFVQEVKEWADGEIDHQGTPQALCKKIEAFTTSINTRAQLLYRKNDKGRHRIRRKIRQQKTTLKAMVAEYNSLVAWIAFWTQNIPGLGKLHRVVCISCTALLISAQRKKSSIGSWVFEGFKRRRRSL
ncbi:uncharacterized protein LOC127363898 [Dicentrarchus labrax]|uniref:uncharacterized protein LOC127363898 n=1 Tax=Dicentrarchus labrax TaxID=13489 RepID=UPI0021F64E88|nr:uncharacterized protein LOC127363898 [Dicentrarchus labrax]